MPVNYNTAKVSTVIKLVAIASFYTLLILMAIYRGIVIKSKLRTFFFYKLNEFEANDVTTIIQIVLGIIIFIMGSYLFLKSEFRFGAFKLPIKDEKEFDTWVTWAEVFRLYRLILGLYAMNQVLNFLLVAAENFPSLGILFETMNRSKHDMCCFTTIIMLLFMSFVTTCNMLFGY